MEGNYAKVLTEKRDKIFDVMYVRLQEAVCARQLQTRADSAATTNATSSILSAVDSAAGLAIISNMIGYAADLERIV